MIWCHYSRGNSLSPQPLDRLWRAVSTTKKACTWTNVERQRAKIQRRNGRPEDRPFRCDPSLEAPSSLGGYVWPGDPGAIRAGGASLLYPGLAEELKNALASLVRLRQHRSAGLL